MGSRGNITAVWLAALLLASAAAYGEEADAPPDRVPVLVELFTSQGCSSCPSADEFLSRLLRVQPVQTARIVALSEHVDYWDDLGWRDPFSSPELTSRQGEYAGRFHGGRVYTPQMVVDGHSELVGNDKAAALRAIHRAARNPKSPIRIAQRVELDDGPPGTLSLDIRIDDPPAPSAGQTLELLLAVTESNISLEIPSGENAGRRLSYDAVVRELHTLGTIEGQVPFETTATVEFCETWNRQELGVVVFAQERPSRRIIGIGQLDLAR